MDRPFELNNCRAMTRSLSGQTELGRTITGVVMHGRGGAADFMFCYRHETYDYFQLPFCKSNSTLVQHHNSLAEALLGVDMEDSGIQIDFLRRLM